MQDKQKLEEIRVSLCNSTGKQYQVRHVHKTHGWTHVIFHVSPNEEKGTVTFSWINI